MVEFENNNATQFAEDIFSTFEFDYRDVPGKEYLQSLNVTENFYEYVFYYAQKCGDTTKNCDSCKIYPICFGVSCPYDRFTPDHNYEKCANRIKDVLLYVKTLSNDISVCKNIDHFFVNNNRGDAQRKEE